MEKEEKLNEEYDLDCVLGAIRDLKQLQALIFSSRLPISEEGKNAIDSVIKELITALSENSELFVVQRFKF